MCKCFSKRPDNFFSREGIKRYCEKLTENQEGLNLKISENGVGTWIHEKLILKLAQWLDVDFEIWCDEQITTLIREGRVELQTPSYTIEDPIERAKMWIKEQEEKKALEYDNSVKTQLIAEYEPKVTYYDTILSDSSSLLNITQIAKDYGLSGKALNTILKDEKVQYKQRGQWLLYSNHVNKGYTKSVTKDVDGIPRISTKWKQKGRLFIHGILEKQGIFANIDKEIDQ